MTTARIMAAALASIAAFLLGNSYAACLLSLPGSPASNLTEAAKRLPSFLLGHGPLSLEAAALATGLVAACAVWCAWAWSLTHGNPERQVTGRAQARRPGEGRGPVGNVIHRGKGSFTHVENTVFFDRELSLKAKGIYCQIRSLEGNPEWVFTIRGFASLVKDGVDSVSAGIRELESAGYVIRARRRGEAGRFLKAEEATWITLDDPAMHDSVADELRAEGFAILSEFVRKDRAPNAREAEEEGRGAEKAQVVPRTGKSVSGPATSGKATSGKPRSGEPGAINYSWDKAPESNQRPLSSSPVEGGSEGEGGFEPYRRGEFPEEFERLCAMSIKPVASLRFKRSCLAAWEKRVAEGYLPAQIADAYGAYAESYRGRNGEDGRLAKNLARWLEGDDGMPVWSDDPIPPDALGCDGEPLDMEGLAKADPGFAKLWRRVASRRNVILSLLYDRNPAASREEFEAECEADETLARHMAACEERYGRYLALCDSMEGGTAAGRRVAS